MVRTRNAIQPYDAPLWSDRFTERVPISVVIPCYNQEKYLLKAVESAALAGCGDIAIFLDQFPLEATLDYAPGVADVCHWIDGSDFRSGPVYARNHMISSISLRHDLIFCLDADDRLLPNGLERLYEAWQPGTWVYSGWQEIDENEAILGDYEAPPPSMLSRKNLCYASFLFHKDDWRKVGGFDPDFEIGCEDYAFQCALTAAGVKPVRVEGQVYQRMIHEGGRTERAKQLFPMLQGLIRAKWPGVFQG